MRDEYDWCLTYDIFIQNFPNGRTTSDIEQTAPGEFVDVVAIVQVLCLIDICYMTKEGGRDGGRERMKEREKRERKR